LHLAAGTLSPENLVEINNLLGWTNPYKAHR